MNGNNNNNNNNPWAAAAPSPAAATDPWTRGEAWNNNAAATDAATAAAQQQRQLLWQTANATATNEILWRERERRQRTVRAFLMMLFLLLLLEDDPQAMQNNNNNRDMETAQQRLRGANRRRPPGFVAPPILRNNNGGMLPLEATVWHTRQAQDAALRAAWADHENVRSAQLRKLNHGQDVAAKVEAWAHKQVEEWKLAMAAAAANGNDANNNHPPHPTPPTAAEQEENAQTVWHYPWNITALFLGEWEKPANDTQLPPMFAPSSKFYHAQQQFAATSGIIDYHNLTQPRALEGTMLQVLQQRQRAAGVYFVPTPIQVREDHNFTSLDWDRTVVDANGRLFSPHQDVEFQNPFWKLQQQQVEDDRQLDSLPLHQNSGRVALRLYSRAVPGMAEMSVIDGSIKILNRHSHHMSSPQDVVVRVRGVLFHRVGQLSLVSAYNAPVTHAALIVQGAATPMITEALEATTATGTAKPKRKKKPIKKKKLVNKEATETARRRLTEFYHYGQDENGNDWDQLREDVWTVHGPSLQSWVDENHRRLQQDDDDGEKDGLDAAGSPSGSLRENTASVESTPLASTYASSNNNTETVQFLDDPSSELIPAWSNVVIPFPFVMDDAEETFRQMRTPASRRLMPQERLLESNAAHCHFELDFQVEPVEWTLGEWRKLMRRKFVEKERLKPTTSLTNVEETAGAGAAVRGETGEPLAAATEPYATRHWPVKPAQPRRRRPLPQDEALVMVLNGTIRSDNCHFFAHVNATALRTNWEVTTSRAMNYSFYMMLVCLAQIIVLLRQLLHSQSQSAATRVSMVSIGWQTVIDGLLCLGHIYLSLALNNLFTPFASVAFFKLLIFCVIEMWVLWHE